MFRRLFFWGSVLASAILLRPAEVRAQSWRPPMLFGTAHDHKMMAQSGCTGYTASEQHSLFMPSDWAAAGNVTATIALYANVTGWEFSHAVTVTPGTKIGRAWSSYCPNTTCTAQFYYTKDSDPTHLGATSISTNGSDNGGYVWTMQAGDVGHTYYPTFAMTGANGSTSLDRGTVIVVAGSGPSIIDQDELPTNLYQQGQFSFSVPPMTQACQQCINDPVSCAGANHTPYITATLKNVNTGETKSVSHVVAGNDFKENEYGYGSWTAGISVLPGDGPEPDPSDPPLGEIFCYAVGADIFNQKSSDNYTWIVAKTKIKISQQGSTTAGVTRWYVDSWCKDTQHTPIWEPLYIDTYGGITPLIKVGQYELSEQDCYAEPGWPAWKCLPITVTPPQPLHIGVGGTKYDCSTLINTPLPK